MLPLVGCENSDIVLNLYIEISKYVKKSYFYKVGEKVREIRTSKFLSQEQLAHLADVHRTYIGMVERAEKNITLVNIEKIANALNINIIELLK